MAYSTPKTNWTAGDIPVASDLIRIESNIESIHDGYIAGDTAEEAARIAADATLTSELAIEVAARIAATESGIYTPTGVNSTNVTNVVESPAKYMRVGSIVTVSGQFTIYLTAGDTWSVFSFNPPIASTFTGATDCSGVASFYASSQAPGIVYSLGSRIYIGISNPMAVTGDVLFTCTYIIR
jgi:hypothetical protein